MRNFILNNFLTFKQKKNMRTVCLFMLLIMVFVPLTAMTDSFADRSPPGVEISTDYELSGFSSQLNVEAGEVRIAVFDCDLKLWFLNPIETIILKSKLNYSCLLFSTIEKVEKDYEFRNISDLFARPVNKHGVKDKEVCYTKNLYSYLIIK